MQREERLRDRGEVDIVAKLDEGSGEKQYQQHQKQCQCKVYTTEYIFLPEMKQG
jgi:hypothetical protein